MGFLALSLLAPGFALSQEDSSGDRVSASAQESEQPADPAETEWQPTYQYMALPPSATPLNSLLPFGGIGASPSLMKTNKGQVFSHDINIATRELDVSEKHVNGVSRDTTTLWTAHYPELTDYVSDMYDVGRKNLWLNGLVGQKDDGYEAPETGSMFDITIPVTMPAWMRDFGLDKPKLMLQGTMDIRLKGYGEKDDAEGSTKTSLWPSPTLTYDPSFMVKGKIGPYITVEINNVESGLGVQNQVRVVYEESYKDEFEDYILQRVEAGTTSLALTGTELTGYSENHQGLFGIKAEWKLGDWRLTTIASQDGGSQEEYTINASETTTEFQVLDKQFIAYRYYFLNHESRNAYINAAIAGRTTSSYPATNLKLYKRSAMNVSKDVLDNITVMYVTPSGKTIEKVVERMVEVPSSDFTYDSKTGILKVNGVNRNTLLAASWSGDGTGRTGTTVRDGAKVVLIQWDANLTELTDIDKLMLRNVYSIGISEGSSSGFVLRMKNKSGVTGSFLKTLGLADSTTGSPLVNDATIFKKDASGNYTGEMWLPCKPLSEYSGSNTTERARKNCLEPFRLLDSTNAMSQLYDLPVYNLNRYTSRFHFESVGKRRNSTISVRDPNTSHSVSAGSCMDISPGTEKLTAGSTVLTRGVDYEVNYELGQIELLSERALDPNKEIKVTFECEPLFEINNKLLLGARAELPLNRYGFGDGSVFGVTALYKSQSTTAETPTLGNEPFNSILWGMNLRLQDTVSALTDLVNKIPGISTTAMSGWKFEAEFAASRHNANTSDGGEALVEDFESSMNGLVYPLSRLSWYHASPPGGVASDPGTYIEDLDYRHKGEFIWHSNSTELYKYIYPNVGNSDVDNQHLTVLKMTLRANDNLMGKSWGGIMRPNSNYYHDLSHMKYVEVVARGNVGSIFIDLGLVSEDISINGAGPNGIYDGENDLGSTTALHDKGLDGRTGSDEIDTVWDCRIAECRPTENSTRSADASTTDIARDNYDDDLEDESDPPVNINGTENNSGERTYDTEDINKNGSLDTDISFVRYRVDLSDTSRLNYEELRNGWRKWRIPLNQYDTIVSSTGSDYRTILSDAQFTRVWIGRLNPGVSEAKVQIVSLGVLGNAWEETTVADLYETSSSEHSQIAEVNGVESTITESTATRDTSFIKVSTINNRENSNKYVKSPNTKTERDTETNAPLKETALVLDYQNLSPGQEVGVTRIFETDTKDFSAYKSIKLEIHYETKADRVPVRFAVQFGEGSLEGSNDYYEWSFRPTNYKCTSSERATDCHEQNWLDNAFAMDISDFSDMKRGRHPPFTEATVKELGGDREERLRLVGNPSITSVDWMRFVIIADSSANPNDLKGTFWIDDLRLSDMDTEWGYAARTSAQVNFADFISLSGAVRYQDGNFATLSTSGGSPKPKMSEAASQLDLGGDINISLNKFLNDSLGFHIPMNLGYNSTTKRPYMKPSDDMLLEKSSFSDMTGDMFKNDLAVTSDKKENKLRDEGESKGYESYTRTKTFSISYSKDYKAADTKLGEVLSQVLLERPAMSYSYTQTEGRATTSADSTYSYHTILEYKLGTFTLFKFKPFDALAKSENSFVKAFAKTEFEPWPQTFDLTLFDFTYIRNVNQDRDPDFVEPQVDKVVTYTADLNHRLNMRWNILSFLSTSYALNIKRDMFGGGDREAFVKENFFSPDDGGLFASDVIFDYDHTDRKVYVSRDSLVIIPYDTIPKVGADGKEQAIDMQNPDSYTILYDSTTFYKVDSVGTREFGRAYGILRNERARSQQFKITFNPRLIPFLPFNTTFSSDFTQQKSIPDDFSFYDETSIEKNFWTISQTNRFEITPTFKILDLAKSFGTENAVARAFEKVKWREIRFGWNTSTNTVGENFTLAQLYEEQNVTPFEYYLYGLGLGNGYRNRGFWNIVTGDMGLDHRDDFVDFAEYRNRHVDTLVYQGNFRHSVSRQFQVGTGITLPFWDIGVTGDLQWKEEFSQSREYPLYIDTTTMWPRIGVGITVPNFAQRISFLNSFRSVSAAHRFDFTRTTTVRPFQSAEDTWTDQLNFNPLIRLTFLTQKNIRIENSVRMKIESTDRRPKEEVIGITSWPDSSRHGKDTTDYFWDTPWIHTSLYNDFAFNIGDDFTISYPLKLKRGFHFFKWYFKLENDLDLKLTAGYDYNKTIRKEYDPDPGYNMWNKDSGTDGVFKKFDVTDEHGYNYIAYEPELSLTDRTVPSRTHEWFLRPSAGYQFNRIASMSSYIEYRQIHEKLDDETPHLRQILQFEIALMLRFN